MLEQVTALGTDVFNEDPLAGCSKRGKAYWGAGAGQSLKKMPFWAVGLSTFSKRLVFCQSARPLSPGAIRHIGMTHTTVNWSIFFGFALYKRIPLS